MRGWLKKNKKPAAETSASDGANPASTMQSPHAISKQNTPFIRFFGPPHPLISRLPARKPTPPTDRTVPRAEAEAKLRTRGVISTKTNPLKKFVKAKNTSRANNPGRDVI